MKKRLTAMLLTAAMVAGCLAGCGNSSSDNGATVSTAGNNAAESSSVEKNEEIVEIYWQYPSYGEISEGFQEMEDALNEMMERDIGVHVNFVTTDLMESQNDAILMVSAGEQLDVCLSFLTGIGNVVDKGLILELDELLEKTGTLEIFKQHNTNPYLAAGYQGHAYGVGCGDTVYNTYGYIMKKSFADKYGFTADDNKIYTIDEIEEMFEIVKAGEGDDFICHVPWNNTYEPLNYSLCEYAKLGGDLVCGVLMLNDGFDNTVIENIFETDEYEEYCNRMYDWAQKGYISADAAITADTADDIVNRPNALGAFGYAAPELGMLENNWNEEVVQFKVVAPYVPKTAAGAIWSIPITSVNPEKALEAIAYIYENKEAAWLIQYGIEGESWEITETDGDNVKGKYTSEDTSTLPYLNVYGLWGDRLDMPAFGETTIDLNAKKKEYNDSLLASERVTPSAGYVFEATSVNTEIAAVQTVVAQYATSLNCGALDPSKALPEFIAAMKDAGVDTIIAENQRQFDEWLKNQD